MIWISQKVSINRDEDRTIGYSVIARDITFMKKCRKEKERRGRKNYYKQSFKILTIKSYSMIKILKPS
jgi:hypothetical protein